ncbi:MAG: hypothetical protein JNJ46_24755 [Myxococcales bacterium]|nr:hypothetical protein [Myxococcales bacterium]
MDKSPASAGDRAVGRADAEHTTEALPVASTAHATPEVTARIDAYCQHHQNVENYVLLYHVVFGLLRRVRIDPQRGAGPVLSVLLVALLFASVPSLVSTWLGEWNENPIKEWLAVLLGFSVLTIWAQRPLTRAIDAFLSLHRNIVDDEGIQRLMEFELRWFRLRRSVPTAAGFSFAIHVYLYYIEIYHQERPMTWGTAMMTMLLLYQVGEIVYAVVLLAMESRLLPRCQYALYRPSPIDTVALRRSLRGTSQLVGLVSLVSTGIIVGFVLLVEDRPIFLNRVGLLLLASAYVSAFAALLLPRLAIKSIVHIAKENQLRPLQGRLSELLENPVSLTEDQYKEFKRIKELHDLLRDASEEVLPMRALGRLFGALLFPTMTFVVSRFGEQVLLPLLRR